MKVSCYLYRESDKALLIGTYPIKDDGAFWIPKSACNYTKRFARHPTLGVRLHLTIEGWFIKDKPELERLTEGHTFR